MRTDYLSVCAGKRAYPDKETARKAAISTRHKPDARPVRGKFTWYACPFDHDGQTAWHVGRLSSSEARRRNPRARGSWNAA